MARCFILYICSNGKNFNSTAKRHLIYLHEYVGTIFSLLNVALILEQATFGSFS